MLYKSNKAKWKEMQKGLNSTKYSLSLRFQLEQNIKFLNVCLFVLIFIMKYFQYVKSGYILFIFLIIGCFGIFALSQMDSIRWNKDQMLYQLLQSSLHLCIAM